MVETPDDEDEWDAAQVALLAAQRMPGGAERIEALKQAGQLRYDADQRRRAVEIEAARKKSARQTNSN